jgi:hypothetical protein
MVTIEIRNVRPSRSLDVTGACDVGVTVTIGSASCSGEVTVVPRLDRPSMYCADFGSADEWISPYLFAWICDVSGGYARDILDDIAATASRAAERA